VISPFSFRAVVHRLWRCRSVILRIGEAVVWIINVIIILVIEHGIGVPEFGKGTKMTLPSDYPTATTFPSVEVARAVTLERCSIITDGSSEEEEGWDGVSDPLWDFSSNVSGWRTARMGGKVSIGSAGVSGMELSLLVLTSFSFCFVERVGKSF